MAGHSQFKNIMHRKGAQDRRRAREFARLSREITVAARSGAPDPASNPRLRAAVAAARRADMPKENIRRAVERASGAGGEGWEEARYEGFGPGGAAVVVEVETDNRNRAAGEMRLLFAKRGGALAAAGAASCRFERVGALRPPPGADPERVLEAAVEAGARDVVEEGGGPLVLTGPDELAAARAALEAALGPCEGGLDWRPLAPARPEGEQAEALAALAADLEAHEDVRLVRVDALLGEGAPEGQAG